MAQTESTGAKWYHGVTRYQWLVLAIASAGWVFDVYEGQIFNITRNQLLADILQGAGGDAAIRKYGDMFLGVFLLGGTAGGLLFGSMADRIGRKPTMAFTILMYSIFSGLTYFAHSLWQVAALRFLVAMGVGGEWAVAASLVAEVFPAKARAHASGIFHATSVLGTWAATLCRYRGGGTPLRVSNRNCSRAAGRLGDGQRRASPRVEASGRKKRGANRPPMGSMRDLLLNPQWAKRALLELLAAVGLGSFGRSRSPDRISPNTYWSAMACPPRWPWRRRNSLTASCRPSAAAWGCSPSDRFACD